MAPESAKSTETESQVVLETSEPPVFPEEPPKPTGNVIQLNATKAGMEGLDVESINRIINETSKGSKFYEHKLKQQKEIERKVQDMKMKLKTFSDVQVRHAEQEVLILWDFFGRTYVEAYKYANGSTAFEQMDKYGELLEKSRDFSRFIVHVDMDAFYASVEMRDDPSLR